jgi:thiol peroxidase
MTALTFKQSPVNSIGSLPVIGTQAPQFSLTKTDLTETTLSDYSGKKLILSIFPSLDTGVCAAGVRHFNEIANQLPNTVVLCISADLPFAQKRFCGAENLDNIITASCFKNTEFGKNYGVTLVDGPLKGLLARAIVMIDEKGKVVYTQQVTELIDDVNYTDLLNHSQ